MQTEDRIFYYVYFLASAIIFSVVLIMSASKNAERRYQQAKQLVEEGEYYLAINILDELGNYSDSASIREELVDSILYDDAKIYYEHGYYEEALALFEDITSYKDSEEYYNNTVQFLKDEGRDDK